MMSPLAPTPVSSASSPSNTRPNRKRLAWVALGLAASTALAFSLSTTTQHAADRVQPPPPHYPASRLLTQIVTTSGIRFTVSAKAADSEMEAITMNGLAIPRNTTTDGDAGTTLLEFDGRLSYSFMGREFNFTVVEGRGYHTIANTTTGELEQNNCLPPGSIMPVNTITDALNGARVVGNGSSVGMADCQGTLLELTFANEPYVICAPDGSNPPANGTDSNGVNAIHGDDIQATFEFLRARNAVSVGDDDEGERLPPTLESLTRPEGKSITECPLLATKDEEVASDDDDDDEEEEGVLGRSCDSSCRDGKKVCLFVHGLNKDLNDTVADSYGAAWGDVHKKVKCCSQTKFIRMDTVNEAWYSDALVDKVCDAAVRLTNSSDPMQLENIAIIAHSMGNLVLANAAMTNSCAVGPTAKWIALAPPMVGSTASNLAVSVCNDEPTVFDDPWAQTLKAVGLCPAQATVSSLVYKGSRQSSKDLDALYQQAEEMFAKYITASMCGVESVGLVSADSFKYGALDVIAGHASGENDGAVEFASCRGPRAAKDFSTSWEGGAFYRASINHGDATGRNGDGWWGNDRKPVKWLNCQI